MKTVGIDVSTFVGLACVHPDGCLPAQVLHFPKTLGQARLQLIAQNVERILSNWAPDLILIEDYGFANRFTFTILVECGTIVRNAVYRLNLPWMEVPPSTLKRWTTGTGSATKEQMALSVVERWGFKSASDDIVDAYALAQMGQLGREKLLKVKGVRDGK